MHFIRLFKLKKTPFRGVQNSSSLSALRILKWLLSIIFRNFYNDLQLVHEIASFADVSTIFESLIPRYYQFVPDFVTLIRASIAIQCENVFVVHLKP